MPLGTHRLLGKIRTGQWDEWSRKRIPRSEQTTHMGVLGGFTEEVLMELSLEGCPTGDEERTCSKAQRQKNSSVELRHRVVGVQRGAENEKEAEG